MAQCSKATKNEYRTADSMCNFDWERDIVLLKCSAHNKKAPYRS